MQYRQIARELLLALRGKRSQVQWSRRLGYKSNVAYAWESGRRWPTAAETLRACERTGIDVRGALIRFYGREPEWLTGVEPATPQGVAQLLDDLRGQATITELAARADVGRYSVSRWLSGGTQPRLPDFLRMVDATSVRLVDLLATLVDPASLPSILPLWEAMEARRRGAFEVPWTQAMLCAIDLEAYQALPRHADGWLAALLGITVEEEQRCLDHLRTTGEIVWDGARWAAGAELAVDTRRYPEIGRWLKAHWSEVAARRVQAGAPGQFSYNVFTVSKADFERIRELHLQYFHALRAIVRASSPDEVVAIANVQLFALEPWSAAEDDGEAANPPGRPAIPDELG